MRSRPSTSSKVHDMAVDPRKVRCQRCKISVHWDEAGRAEVHAWTTKRGVVQEDPCLGSGVEIVESTKHGGWVRRDPQRISASIKEKLPPTAAVPKPHWKTAL